MTNMTNIFYNSKGQVIGKLKDGIFRKKVKKSKHYMRVLNAWGLDVEVVDKLRASKCTEIRILDTESQSIYSTPFEVFDNKGFVKDFSSEQKFLVIKHWNITNGVEILQERYLEKDDVQDKLL